jgi:3',5'-cyclic-AMP phosphodiesterase
MKDISRRQLLRNFGAGALALGAGVIAPTIKDREGNTLSTASAETLGHSKKRNRSIRIAHLTDMHVEPELHAGEGFAKALRHCQSHKDKPELILFGGDHVMDSYEADDARTALQWKLFHSVCDSECSIPHESCIGNHDIWGWIKDKAKTTGNEPNFGKQRAIDELKLSGRYRSFDKGGWHFVILDSVSPDGSGYHGVLDEEQFAWLEQDLKAHTDSPIFVMSHIPLFSVTAFIDNQVSKGVYTIYDGSVHKDSNRFRMLVKAHPNVKVAVSGHTHLIDRVDYNGVSYFCNGAVSGSWWRGPNGDGDCPEGYAIMDLYDDGSFEHEYVAYGWVAQV